MTSTTASLNQALLVIDMQQGLCEGDGAAWQSAVVIDRINALTARARDASVPIIWVQHESADELPLHSPGWQLAHGLEPHPQDHYVRKTTPDAFLRTPLQALLERLQVQQLVICGMHTEFCVDTTARRALALGYPVTLVADAHTSAGNAVLTPAQTIAHHNATLTHISSFGPRVQAISFAEVPLP
jgi:nicotinamidase-related amidase